MSNRSRPTAQFADAYNNLGVVFYEERKYGAAVKEYRQSHCDGRISASFFSNLGAALFAKKEFEPAVLAYQQAMDLDPDVFERTSRGGVQAQLPSPEDRARYDYTVAKLYAKMGFSDRSLEYLRKAMEEGYKDFKNVYKDVEFAELRKDKRFTELVATKYSCAAGIETQSCTAEWQRGSQGKPCEPCLFVLQKRFYKALQN